MENSQSLLRISIQYDQFINLKYSSLQPYLKLTIQNVSNTFYYYTISIQYSVYIYIYIYTHKYYILDFDISSITAYISSSCLVLDLTALQESISLLTVCFSHKNFTVQDCIYKQDSNHWQDKSLTSGVIQGIHVYN